MAVADTDVLFLLSGAASAGATSTPAASLGGNVSNVTITGSINTLWDNLSSTEVANGDTEYRCFGVKNTHATDSMTNVGIYVSAQPAATDRHIDIGVDTAAAGTAASSTVANESTAPSGISFTRPSTSGTALSMGTIAAGNTKFVWVKRTADGSGSGATDSPQVAVIWDS